MDESLVGITRSFLIPKVGGELLLDFGELIEEHHTDTVMIDIASLVNALSVKSCLRNLGTALPIHIDGEVSFFIQYSDSVNLYRFNPDTFGDDVNPALSKFSRDQSGHMSDRLLNESLAEVNLRAPDIMEDYMSMIM